MTSRNEVVEIFRNAASTQVTVHHVGHRDVNVFIGNDLEVLEAQAREVGEAAIARGRSVTWVDGTKEWINVSADWVDDGYVWNDDQNRIRCTRTRVRVSADGTRTEEKLRPTWRNYDVV